MSNLNDCVKKLGSSKGAKMLKVFLRNRVLVSVLVVALVLAALPLSAFVASAAVEPIVISANGKSVTFNLEDDGYASVTVYYGVFPTQEEADMAILNNLGYGGELTLTDGVWSISHNTALVDGQVVACAFGTDINTVYTCPYTAGTGGEEEEEEEVPAVAPITIAADGTSVTYSIADNGYSNVELFRGIFGTKAEADAAIFNNLGWSGVLTLNDGIWSVTLNDTLTVGQAVACVFSTDTTKVYTAEYVAGSGSEEPDDPETPDAPVVSDGILDDVEFVSVGADGVWVPYVGSDWAWNNATVSGDGNGALTIDIATLGGGWDDALWSLKVSQSNVAIEAGKNYKLTFTVESTLGIDKKVKAKFDTGEAMLDEFVTVPAGGSYTFEKVFAGTDYTGDFIFAAGGMAGESNAASGKLVITGLTLVETDEEPTTPDEPEIPDEPEDPDTPVVSNGILKDVEFTSVAADGIWVPYVGSDWAWTNATVTGDSNGALTIDYAAVGGGWADALWGLQITQSGVKLAADAEYRLTFDVASTLTTDKTLKVKFAGGEAMLDDDVVITAGGTYSFDKTFTATEFTGDFLFAAGGIAGEDVAASGELVITNLKLERIYDSILKDTEFSNVGPSDTDNIWVGYTENWAGTTMSISGDGAGNLTLDYDVVGNAGYFDAIWSVQITQHNVVLENGKTYRLLFDAVSTMDGVKSLKVKFDGGEAMLDDDFAVPAGETYSFDKTFEATADYNGKFLFAGGWMAGDTATTGEIVIKNITLYEVPAEDIEVPDVPVLDDPADFTGRTVAEMEADGWTLIWNDEFDGTALDTSKWFVQTGTGSQYGLNGWGNNEDQYYQADNATVADGQLTITAIAEAAPEGKKYTSSRIRTATDDTTLFASTYGRYEALISLPAVSGAWPAFWLLPDSGVYGGWPVSGEIDIMEAKGNTPGASSGTLHYGTPGQLYKGAEHYFDTSVTNMEGYHLYAVEWEPGVIRWYVDDELFYTADTWAAKHDGNADNYTFGAPYDAPFHIILNLALGGTFGAGAIDTAALAEGIEMKVDYVRVYHDAEGYDDSNVNAGTAGADSSFADTYYPDYQEGDDLLIGDDFASLEVVPAVDPDSDGWQFYTGAEFGAAATVETVEKDGTTYAHVNITNVGNQTYSVQLIEHLPLAKGYSYKITFDAYANANRTFILKPSGDADNGWAGYASETISVTNEPKTYSYSFTMGNDSDPTARLEFNLGGTSAGDLYIGNVKVEITEAVKTDSSVSKTQLSNGNLIWNGTFDQGTSRLGYWLTENVDAVVPVRTLDKLSNSDKMADETYINESGNIVTGDRNYTRRAELTATAEGGKFYQNGLTLKQSDSYKLLFDLYSENDTEIEIQVTNKDGSVVYATDTISYSAADGVKAVSSVFAMPLDVTDKEAVVAFVLPNGASVQIDDVVLNALTQNNAENVEIDPEPVPEDSSDWYVNYYTLANDPISPDADGVYTVDTWPDTINYNSMLLHVIDNLAKGVKYTLKFDAKSDVANEGYMVNIQQDNTWAMAMPENISFDTTTDWQTYTFEFVSGLEVAPNDANTTYLKYLLSDCAETTQLHLRNISLTTEKVEDAVEAPTGFAAEDVELGEDVVITVTDEAWAEKFDDSGVIMLGGKNVPYTFDKAAGTITIDGSNIDEAGDYTAQLTTKGYMNAVVDFSVYEYAERTEIADNDEVAVTAVMRSDVVIVVEEVSAEDGEFLDLARDGRIKIGYYEIHYEKDGAEIPYDEACKGESIVYFDIPAEYVDSDILVHHRTGELTYDEYEPDVTEGLVAIIVDSFSPFSVITTETEEDDDPTGDSGSDSDKEDDKEDDKDDDKKPQNGSDAKTGDSGMTVAIIVNVLVLSAVTAAYLKREELEKLVAKLANRA